MTTSDGQTRRYAGVLVANGHNSVPAIPTVPGTFAGKTIHPARTTTPATSRGGASSSSGPGNSGCDIASELSQAG